MNDEILEKVLRKMIDAFIKNHTMQPILFPLEVTGPGI